MKRSSKILTVAVVSIISFAQIPFTAFADDNVTEYQVWIGNTQVTSENKDDVLSDGGSVKYDPEIHLLTFDNPQEIEGSTYANTRWAVILAKESVTMTGTLDLINNNEQLKEIGIWCHGKELILDNFKVSVTGFSSGITSLLNSITIQNDSDVYISESRRKYSTTYSISAYNKLSINNSRVTVENCDTGIGLNCKKIYIDGDSTFVKSSNVTEGEPIVTGNLYIGDKLVLDKDKDKGIYTVKPKKIHNLTYGIKQSDNEKTDIIDTYEYEEGADVKVALPQIEEGYELDKVIYTFDRKEYDITDSLSFTMPDGNVTVDIVVKKKNETEIGLTYPTNIKVDYSEDYHQIRFTWDKVQNADRYGIAVYLAGKWRIQTQSLTTNTYTSPKNLTPGKTYKVAIAARVNGKWDTSGAIYHAVTVTVK